MYWLKDEERLCRMYKKEKEDRTCDGKVREKKKRGRHVKTNGKWKSDYGKTKKNWIRGQEEKNKEKKKREKDEFKI